MTIPRSGDLDDVANLVDAVRSFDTVAGYRAVVAVAPDGSEHFVIAEKASLNNTAVVYSSICPDVEHEQLGALSVDWAARIWLTPARCGRRRKSGGRCRMPVRRPGQACQWHRARKVAR